jgi:membrane protein YdbS with pleckstrin-like domain
LLTLWRVLLLAVLVPVGVLGVLSAGLSAGLIPAFAVLALVLLTAGLGWAWTARRWAAWGWAEREDDLLVRRGVLVRRVSVVPYGRMQYVDVLAGPLDRRIGVAAVHLHTAAAAADVHVPGLERAEADRLRDRLAALGEARAAGL